MGNQDSNRDTRLNARNRDMRLNENHIQCLDLGGVWIMGNEASHRDTRLDGNHIQCLDSRIGK